MRLYFLSFLFTFFFKAMFAQLPEGSIAPNFIMSDLNGVEHNLYSYLDSGYTVVVDFSAAWCGTCWNYHNTGALEELYIEHGPLGMPGVSDTTTNDVMVFFIEGDQSTIDELNGIGNGTQGNWVEGTLFPIIPTISPNNTQVLSAFEVSYFPTVYTICPNRKIKESGLLTSEDHYIIVQKDCSPIFDTGNDVRIYEVNSPFGSYCDNSISPELLIQNLGQNTLTFLDVVAYINNIAVDTFFWEGSLERFFIDTIIMETIFDLEFGYSEFKIVTMNPNGTPDEDVGNDTATVDLHMIENGEIVTVSINTDNVPEEISWDIKLGDNIIAEGGEYSYSSTFNTDVCIYSDSCYMFTIYDAYGDGIPGGFAKVFWRDSVIVNIDGSSFGTVDIENFCLGTNNQNDFLAYDVEFSDYLEIDTENHEIIIEVAEEMDEAFIAEFTLSPGAIAKVNDVLQTSAVSENSFVNNTLVYTVIAENGDSQEWKVILNLLANGNEFLSYSVYGSIGEIDKESQEVYVEINLDKLRFIPEFTLSPKAVTYIDGVFQLSGVSEVDFDQGSIVYNIVAENGDSVEWVVNYDIYGDVAELDAEILVYPNPTSGLVNIEGVEGANIELYNTLGEKVYTINTANNEESIVLDEFNHGIYFVKIIKGTETEVVRFIYSE